MVINEICINLLIKASYTEDQIMSLIKNLLTQERWLHIVEAQLSIKN